MLRYHAATGDDAFLREAGLDILVATARLWCKVAHLADDGYWHIAGVTEPDEYTALMDDNVYTNLMMLRGDAFTAGEKARNFAYYEARTVRDSSLSAPAQAVLAAEVGHLDLAHDYLAEAALLDLRAGGEASGDGLHIAACAGAWIALVMGFGGLRDHGGRLSFAPRLPEHLPRLRFRLRWRDSRLVVTVTPSAATYEVAGPAVEISHHGETFTVAGSITRAIPSVAPDPEPMSPRPPKRRST